MPESYDQDGDINQKKRLTAAFKRYRDPIVEDEVKPFASQEAWEKNQIARANLKFGPRDI